MKPADPIIWEFGILNDGAAWLLFLLAHAIFHAVVTMLFRRTTARARAARRIRRQRIGARHAATGEPWRGEIPPTWVLPVIPTVAPIGGWN